MTGGSGLRRGRSTFTRGLFGCVGGRCGLCSPNSGHLGSLWYHPSDTGAVRTCTSLCHVCMNLDLNCTILNFTDFISQMSFTDAF